MFNREGRTPTHGYEATPEAAWRPPALVLVLRVPLGAYFTCHYEGVSHAEWPKDRHE
jgi:hypothetical protein